MIANAARLKEHSKRYEETKKNLRALEKDNKTLRNCIGVICHGKPDINPLEDSPVRLLNIVHALRWTTRRSEKNMKADLTNASEAAREAESALKEAVRQLEKEKTVSQTERLQRETDQIKLKEETARREAAEDSLLCVVCIDKPRKKMLLPCKHILLCDKCSLDTCPICRTPALASLDVFLS